MTFLATERKERHMPLDRSGSPVRSKHPIGNKVALIRSAMRLGDLEEPVPHRAGCTGKCFAAVSVGHVLPNRVPLEAVDATFALLEINRVSRKVPMHHGVAVEMEVESFLPHRRRGEDKRPEWRVESMADVVDAHFILLI